MLNVSGICTVNPYKFGYHIIAVCSNQNPLSQLFHFHAVQHSVNNFILEQFFFSHNFILFLSITSLTAYELHKLLYFVLNDESLREISQMSCTLALRLLGVFLIDMRFYLYDVTFILFFIFNIIIFKELFFFSTGKNTDKGRQVHLILFNRI